MKYSIVENILQGLNRSTEIVSSAVVSTDGLPIATALQIGVDEDRIGAMSAAMLSLGTRSAKEVLQGSLNHSIIHTDNGYMLLFQAAESNLLTITTTRDAKLGLVLFEAKRALKEIARHFGE